MNEPDRNQDFSSPEAEQGVSGVKPARLSATLLGALIGAVQLWAMVMYCTIGAGAVAVAQNGWRLSLAVTASGVLVGGVVGCIAAPAIWTGRNLREFAAIIVASILVGSVFLTVLSAIFR